MRNPFLRPQLSLVCLAALTTATFGLAAPTRLASVTQRGDFVLFGNTLGWDCGAPNPSPPTGTTLSCAGTSNTADSATDIYWRSEDNATAAATSAITMENARSTAELVLPTGATVTHARFYWAAMQADGAAVDNSAVIDRPGNTNVLNVTAAQTWQTFVAGTAGKFWYQGAADVTTWVAGMGAGAFRVGGVSSVPNLYSYDDSNTMAGWFIVVYYALASDPPRSLTIFEGLDRVGPASATPNITATIDGFLVPSAYDAKLGVVAYEGDSDATGDNLSIQGQSDAAFVDQTNRPGAVPNPRNFFNSARTYLTNSVSNALDRPQLSGNADTLAGLDMHVIDLKPRVNPGETSATIRVASTGENIGLSTLVTSIATFKPDFSSSGKTVTDVNGGALVPNDVLEYTVTVTNNGSDTSTNTVMTDAMPTQVTYVPGSLALVSPVAATLTDAVDVGDTGQYVGGATPTITVRLGTGATSTVGGTMVVGASITLRFRVTLNADARGIVENQAVITAGGAQGAPASDYPTDGNGPTTGTPPTTIGVDSDADGIPDATEVAIGTNPNDPDSDDDGVLDGAEPSPGVDSDGDGLINALDPDSDNDGLFDGTEMGLGCGNAATNLSASRCVADADSGVTVTNPLLADTDSGGVSDGSEDFNLNGRVDTGETNPVAGQGADDVTVVDTDGDGLSNGVEATLGSDPNDKDSDDDGVLDGIEPNPSDDGDRDGLVDVLDSDSDDDGLYDGTEIGLDCSNAATDATAQQCIADLDAATHTSAVNPDTDGGGVRDGSEDVNRNGRVDGTETNPVAGQSADDTNIVNTDTDGDGLTNAVEATLCSDVNSVTVCSNSNDADSDDDGVPDGAEPNPAADTNGDGVINVLDPDSDGDGLFDGTELGYACSGAGTAVNNPITCIADGDLGVTWTSPVDPDTDHGGIGDGTEDSNFNGVVDTNERNPKDRTDDNWACFVDSNCDASVTSGRVCNTSHTCIDGCRGSGGNGCPTGQICSSTTVAIGTCSTPAGEGGAAGAAGSAGAGMAGAAPSTGGALATGGATVAGSAGTVGAMATGGAVATGGDASAGAATAGATNGGEAATGGNMATGGTAPSEGGAATGGTPEGVGGKGSVNDGSNLEGGGCDCAVAGKNGTGKTWLLAMIAGLLLLRRKSSR